MRSIAKHVTLGAAFALALTSFSACSAGTPRDAVDLVKANSAHTTSVVDKKANSTSSDSSSSDADAQKATDAAKAAADAAAEAAKRAATKAKAKVSVDVDKALADAKKQTDAAFGTALVTLTDVSAKAQQAKGDADTVKALDKKLSDAFGNLRGTVRKAYDSARTAAKGDDTILDSLNATEKELFDSIDAMEAQAHKALATIMPKAKKKTNKAPKSGKKGSTCDGAYITLPFDTSKGLEGLPGAVPMPMPVGPDLGDLNGLICITPKGLTVTPPNISIGGYTSTPR